MDHRVDLAPPLRRSKPGSNNRNRSSCRSRVGADARDLKRIDRKRNRVAHDAVLQDLGIARSRWAGYLSNYLSIAPAFHHAIRSAKSHLASALRRAETGPGDRHLRSRDAYGRRNGRNRRGTDGQRNRIRRHSILLHLGCSGLGTSRDRRHDSTTAVTNAPGSERASVASTEPRLRRGPGKEVPLWGVELRRRTATDGHCGYFTLSFLTKTPPWTYVCPPTFSV